jgi:hypothetical protein
MAAFRLTLLALLSVTAVVAQAQDAAVVVADAAVASVRASQTDSGSNLLCHDSESACESYSGNTCTSGSDGCLNGVSTVCSQTSSSYNWYCNVYQTDSSSGARCYTSESNCEASSSNTCTNAGTNCVNGASTSCSQTGLSYNYYCPASNGPAPTSNVCTAADECDGCTTCSAVSTCVAAFCSKGTETYTCSNAGYNSPMIWLATCNSAAGLSGAFAAAFAVLLAVAASA